MIVIDEFPGPQISVLNVDVHIAHFSFPIYTSVYSFKATIIVAIRSPHTSSHLNLVVTVPVFNSHSNIIIALIYEKSCVSMS